MGQARVTGQGGYGHRMEDHAVAFFDFANDCRAIVEVTRDSTSKAWR